MNRKLVVALGAIAVVLLIGLLGYGLTRDARTLPSTLIESPAPPFTLETLDGDTVRLADFAGQVVVLNFWASWCLPCLQEHPLLVAVDEEFSEDGVQVVGVVYQDTRANAQRWMRERGGHWPNALDPGSRVAIEYGISGVPETFFIRRDGRIAHKQIGPVSLPLLQDWLPRLVEEPPPPGLSHASSSERGEP